LVNVSHPLEVFHPEYGKNYVFVRESSVITATPFLSSSVQQRFDKARDTLRGVIQEREYLLVWNQCALVGKIVRLISDHVPAFAAEF